MRRGRLFLDALVNAVQRLKRDEGGGILVYVALALPPLLLVVGVAVDVSHIFLVKQRLANAVDAAALAVGALANLSDDEAKTLGESFISAHYTGKLKSSSVTRAAAQVNVAASVEVPMYFMQILNTQSVEISVSAQALRPQGKLEIALVLDRTGSMDGEKIANLKLAAKDLIDIVVVDNQTEYYSSKVAIVPYAGAVNVAGYANSVRGSITSGLCLLPGCMQFKFLNPLGQLKTHDVSTCVTERTGAHAFTDAAPSVQLLGTHYPPVASSLCPSNAIVPLTNDKSLLKGQIDLLVASGSTAGHIGIAWGWYLLSPSWGYLWPANQPAPYTDPLAHKFMVLMTDGEYNSAYCKGVISRDSISGSGSTSDHIDCDAPNGNSYHQSETLCTNIKAAGITVFTVGFNVIDNQSAKDLMAHCATDPSKAYLAATGDQLRQAFRDIASKISALRLAG